MKFFVPKLFLLSVLLFSNYSLEAKVKKKNQKKIGLYSTIVKIKDKKALLDFGQEVNVEVGKIYKTDIKGITFNVQKVSPQKNRVIGSFNKSKLKGKKKILIYDISPYIETAVKNEAKEGDSLELGSSKNFSYSIFYAFSFGQFSEKIAGAKVESSQNSPFTIGASLNYKFNDQFSYSGSGYFSKFNSVDSKSSEVSNFSKTSDIPWEYGFTSYLEYPGMKYFIKPYLGLDFESFSTFNTDELNNNSSVGVEMRTHYFLYATVGGYMLTNIANRRGIFKASISTNLTSASSRESTVSNEDFNGQKFILFFATNVWKNWGASIMYKRHMMSGPTDLTISRFGLGVTYRFQ